jgi:hypothetical protein
MVLTPLGASKNRTGCVSGQEVTFAASMKIEPKGGTPLLWPERYIQVRENCGAALRNVTHLHQSNERSFNFTQSRADIFLG